MLLRTIRVKLLVTGDGLEKIYETVREFTEAYNEVVSYGWEHDTASDVELHHATYRKLRERFPDLRSDLIVEARRKAAETLRALRQLQRRGYKVSEPRSSRQAARFLVPRTVRFSWDDPSKVELALRGGWEAIPIKINPYALRTYFGWEARSADLVIEGGKGAPQGMSLPQVFLCMVFRAAGPEVAPTGECIGVDFRLDAVVTSKNKFYKFDSLRNAEERYFRLRRALQKVGTKSARRHLKKIRRKLGLLRRDRDHVVSKRVVESVAPGAVIVLEDLRGMRKRAKRRGPALNRAFASWSFHRIGEFIEYKAASRGIACIRVRAAGTSRECSRCGQAGEIQGKVFKCGHCGLSLASALNAARNIERAGREKIFEGKV